jgi:transcriptional regulator with XRE-family HTH domain
MNLFAERLNTARRASGLKAKDLAAKLGISAGYYSEIENGKKPPSGEIAKKLAVELHTNATWLLTGKGDMRSPVQAMDLVTSRPSGVSQAMAKIQDQGLLYGSSLSSSSIEEALRLRIEIDQRLAGHPMHDAVNRRINELIELCFHLTSPEDLAKIKQ